MRNTIPKSVRKSFRAALATRNADQLSNLEGDLDHIIGCFEGTIVGTVKVPKAVPESLRKRIAVLNRRMLADSKELLAIIDPLYEDAGKALDRREAADQKKADKERCSLCGAMQPETRRIPSKRR
jgi:hypothetical protein